jgi:hypothetical protein
MIDAWSDKYQVTGTQSFGAITNDYPALASSDHVKAGRGRIGECLGPRHREVVAEIDTALDPHRAQDIAQNFHTANP